MCLTDAFMADLEIFHVQGGRVESDSADQVVVE
jgi:hypothetical protein